MPQFKITYGVGGGYNDITEEVIEAENLNDAMHIASGLAEEVYESYGIFEEHNDVEEFEDDEDYLIARENDMQSWIDFNAEEV